MTKQGFIKLYRQIQDHWLYEEKRKFSKFEAWVDMLMLANHKENKFVLGNDLIELERGQFVTSELKLMERWDWGKAKLRSFLDLLEKDGMIIKKSDRKKTTITICNYGVYHDYDTENRPRTDYNQTDNRLSADTNKNDKNDKNDKEEKTYLQIEDLRQRYSDDQLNFIDEYFDMLRHTRKSAKISENVILKIYKKFNKYPTICVEYGVKTHTDNPAYHSKQEQYTLGIIRNTTADEAFNKLNKKTKPKGNTDWEAL